MLLLLTGGDDGDGVRSGWLQKSYIWYQKVVDAGYY